MTFYLNSYFRRNEPNSRKIIDYKNLKRNFHIGLQPETKVTSGVIGLAMLAFWEGIIAETDVQAIYKTGKECFFFYSFPIVTHLERYESGDIESLMHILL